MGTIWFCLVAFHDRGVRVAGCFDLGLVRSFWVAKTDEERRQVLASIARCGDGNEVWLIAAGGTMYFAFPASYAIGFQRFLPATEDCWWLLILRGARSSSGIHIKSAVWIPRGIFCLRIESATGPYSFGAALGIRGARVPLDRQRLLDELNGRLGRASEGATEGAECTISDIQRHGSAWYSPHPERATPNVAASCVTMKIEGHRRRCCDAF